MSGRTNLVIVIIGIGIGCIGGRRPLDALVILEQTRVRVLEVDERSCQPSVVVVKALTLSEPVAQV